MKIAFFLVFYGSCLCVWVCALPAKVKNPPKCGVKANPVTTRQKRFVLHNSLWTKSVITWRIDKYSKDLSKYKTRKIIKKAFRKWAVWIPIQFVEKRWGEVDISIKFVTGYHEYCTMSFDGRGGDIAHAFYPFENEGLAGDIHFDDDEKFTDSIYRGKNLAWTALHEIGHSLGLQHSNKWGAVMSPYYTSFFHPYNVLSLSSDDIKGIQTLYGTPMNGVNSVESKSWYNYYWYR